MQGTEGSFAHYCLRQGIEGGAQGSCRRNLEVVGGKASPCQWGVESAEAKCSSSGHFASDQVIRS